MRRAALAFPLLAAACGGPGTAPGETAAPAGLRGAVVIEPARLTVGDVAHVEVTVVTPPGHRVRPFEPPHEVPGFWLLDAETLPTERSAARWVHRTRLRARAREPGEFAWPALRVEVEGPGEERTVLELEERPLAVEAVAERFAGRDEPFRLRDAPEPSARPGPLLPAAAGALAALTAVGVAAGAVRRRRRLAAAAVPPPRPLLPAWRAAQSSLAAALDVAAAEPARAADAATAALRRLVAESFAVPAPTLTTEELGGLAAPLGTGGSWPALLELLAELDGVRFAPDDARPEREPEAVRAGIRRALALVTALSPEARRG